MKLSDALASKICHIPDILAGCKADSTTKSYYYSFLRWKRWALIHDLPISDVLPAKALPVAIYLASLCNECNSSSPIIQAFYGINWAHSTVGVESPTDTTLVKNVLEGAKRRLAKPVNKKEPLDVDTLHKIFNSLYQHRNIYNQRTICAFLIAFAGFLRVSELLNIRLSDLCFYDTHMTISIPKSKTDIYRDGNSVVIARSANKYCPVHNLELFLSWCDFHSSNDSDSFIFRNFKRTKTSYELRKDDKPLTYTRMRELFRSALQPFVTDVNKYGLHSLRSGGATTSASLGVPDRLFKRHGRWRSETAKDGYVKDSLYDRLSVSSNLNI